MFQLVDNSSDKELSKEDRANVLDILWEPVKLLVEFSFPLADIRRLVRHLYLRGFTMLVED